jgi:hypothetical protein
MKLLVVLGVFAVVFVVVAGGLVFSLSGPHPLATKVVNFRSGVATSVIDRCALGNGELHISGTTTATQNLLPHGECLRISWIALSPRPDHSSVSPRSRSKFVVACQHSGGRIGLGLCGGDDGVCDTPTGLVAGLIPQVPDVGLMMPNKRLVGPPPRIALGCAAPGVVAQTAGSRNETRPDSLGARGGTKFQPKNGQLVEVL